VTDINTVLAHPAVNPETAPWWEALAKGRLLVKRCDDCGEHHHYPRARCPYCRSENTSWTEAAGTGTVYSYTCMRRETPVRVVAYVTLAEGVSLFTNLVDCEADDVSVGMSVALRMTAGDDGLPLATFAPA
jgi:uncharacterized OB-fold protein